MARGADCKNCPLFGGERGPVMGELRPGAKAVLVGEGPGKWEVKEGRSFVGPGGKELAKALLQENATRSDVSITNVVLCQPPNNQDMERYLRWCKENNKPSPIDCCSKRLDNDLEQANAVTYITLGGMAMETLAKRYGIPVGGKKQKSGDLALAKISQQRGHPLPLPDGKFLLPTLHPAFAARSAKHMLQAVRDDIATGLRIAVRGFILNEEPPYIIQPTIEQVENWCATAVRLDAHVMCDIETAGLEAETTIRCIGLGYDYTNAAGERATTIISVPFVLRNGNQYWETDIIARRARAAVEAVLNRCRLIFHNGAFDTKVLCHWGWIYDRKKLFDDSMLAHRNSREVECPHKLSFVSTRFGEFILWKGDVDHRAVEASDTDEDYWRYNVRDVHAQLVCWRGLQRWMEEDGTRAQYEADKIIARIYRDVGELGWYIDEPQRQLLSKQINARVDELHSRLVAHVGDAWVPKSKCKAARSKDPNHRCEKCQFNPASPHQVAWYLFKHLGLIPSMNKQGKQYQPDDETTTATPALLAMCDNGLDERAFKFVDTLILFRSADKLRSSYIDALDPATIAKKQKDGKKKTQLTPSEFPDLNHLKVTWLLSTDTGRLSSNPNCFHPDTEIKTRTGWKSITELQLRDEIEQFHPATRTRDYACPTALTQRTYAGELITADDLFCVTPDHHVLLPEGVVWFKQTAGGLTAGSSVVCSTDDWCSQLYDRPIERVERMPYVGQVYCLSVPSSYVITRFRGGSPVVIGQCQNIPDRTSLNIKTMFVAPPGHVLVKADFEQIEARIFAWIAQDKAMLKAFREELDVHSLNAATVFARMDKRSVQEIYDWLQAETGGASPAERALYRTCAKRIVFAKQYGVENEKMFQILSGDRDKATNERTLPQLAEMPRDEAKALVKDLSAGWDSSHPEMKEFQVNINEQIKQQGYVVEQLSGRRRHFPDGPNQPGQPYNFPIQACHPAFTQVLTDRGYMALDALFGNERGRSVWTGSAWASFQVLLRGEDNIVWLTLKSGKRIACDTREYVKVPEGDNFVWRKLLELQPGDRIAAQLVRSLRFARPTTYVDEIVSIDVTDEKAMMFTLSVDHEDHSYVADGIISQNCAATFANRAAEYVDEMIPHRGWSHYSGLICQVHDELTVCVPEERAAEAVVILEKAMSGMVGDIAITAEAEVVRRWSGPLCACGQLKKAHKGKKDCGNFTPKDPRFDTPVVLPVEGAVS